MDRGRPPVEAAETGEAAHGVLAAPAPHTQYPLLDSLRGFAALSILVVHVAIFSQVSTDSGIGPLLTHLDVGVPFFFLLSAFLLYRPFVAARLEGGKRRGFGVYAKRRFLRIVPAYWAALTIAAIVPGFVGAFTGNWWVYYGLLQNHPVYTPSAECLSNPFRCGIPVAWSLTVEVTFYALLPFWVLLMDRVARPGAGWLRRELLAVAALAAVSVVVLMVGSGDAWKWFFYSPLGRGLWFGLGLALAAVSVAVARRGSEPAWVSWVRRHPAVPWAAAGAIYAATSYLFEGSALSFPLVGRLEFTLQYAAVGLVALLVLVPAIFGQDAGGWPRRLLAHRTTTWLGLISYGIFLWQLPVLVGLTDLGVPDLWPGHPFLPLLVLGFAGTVACAAISYYALELPLMRRFRGRSPRAVAATAPAGSDRAGARR